MHQMENNMKKQRSEADLALTNSLAKQDYKIIKKIGEGTFSEVTRVQNLKDGKHYACKTMKQSINSLQQAHNLREVQAMKRLSLHPNILQLHEVIFDEDTRTLSLICELMEMNIYELIRGRQYPLPESKAKNYMYQLCKALDHMHSNGIFHRDVKPENILIKHDVLKLADFGSSRSVYCKPPHTEYISTRWYRAPECLLTDGYYSLKMDMWSAGCVFFEIISLNPLFPGTNEVDQVSKIHDVLGTPDSTVLQKFKQSRVMPFDFLPRKGCGLSKMLPHCSASSLSLLYQMLAYDPDERISPRAALQHTCFRELRLAERRALGHHRTIGVVEDSSSMTPGSVEQFWRNTRQGRRQQRLKHVAEPLSRHILPRYPVELPKLNVVVPTPKVPYPVSSLPALAIPHKGLLPAITSKKCHSRSMKPREEPHRSTLKSYYMPPLERKGGGY
ncbi:MAPK/MAK/MRK overlapping kinase-like isoform X1 [Hemibagrus wyckioides]|uniref:MAPK/MAK/MRK overlapping kinase-like isoform X1 n=1 Tax=Hemibagrus wyckioides TaxID=337641 RepID=UPI00266B8AF6|nr:MAPK/MAK/MRK overlapping kinase-like isoform X1 [Hemibagrus wyckioides]